MCIVSSSILILHQFTQGPALEIHPLTKIPCSRCQLATGHGQWLVLIILRCSRLCCSFHELLILRALFRLFLHMMAPGPGFSSRALRFAWARLSVTADVEGQCLEGSDAYRGAA